jgi:hypothetical protein
MKYYMGDNIKFKLKNSLTKVEYTGRTRMLHDNRSNVSPTVDRSISSSGRIVPRTYRLMSKVARYLIAENEMEQTMLPLGYNTLVPK